MALARLVATICGASVQHTEIIEELDVAVAAVQFDTVFGGEPLDGPQCVSLCWCNFWQIWISRESFGAQKRSPYQLDDWSSRSAEHGRGVFHVGILVISILRNYLAD